MSAVFASKENEILEELNNRIYSSKPWTSSDTAHYLNEADKFFQTNPEIAYVIKGIVYTHDKDEYLMRKNFELALEISENETVICNYMTSLQKFDYLIDVINLGLKYENIVNSKEIIRLIAKSYLQLGMFNNAKYYMSKILSNDEINQIIKKEEPYIHLEANEKMKESFRKDREIWKNLANL